VSNVSRAKSKGTRSLPPEIEAQVQANAKDRELRARIRYELRGSFASWGLSRADLAALLESEAGLLRAADEADRARERQKARGR
jgi:hypothetical protein